MTQRARTDRELLAHLLNNVQITPAGCWEWQRNCSHKGYGQIWHAHKMRGTHRVMYALVMPAIPSGLQVLHTCDNPRCIYPLHLRLGTHQDNVDDKVRKGRQLYGVRVHTCKLSAAQAAEIRVKAGAGQRPVQLSRDYGISCCAVHDIIHRRTWKSII